MFARITAAVLLLLLTGCTSTEGVGSLGSHDPEVKARLQAARSSLAQIKSLRKADKEYRPACESIKRVFLKELKQHPTRAGRQLGKDLEKACEEKRRR